MNTQTIMTLIDQYGYLAIVFLIALENVFPPIPSEVVLTFTGFLTLTSHLTVWGAILAATAGSILGAIILYGVGRLVSVERLDRFVETRMGRLLRLKQADIERAGNFFNRRGNVAIFYGRFVPVVRSLISIPAGMAEYPFWSFVSLSTLGTLIWNTVLITAGRLAGTHWKVVLGWFEEASVVIIVAVIVVSLLGFIYYYRKKRHP
ncbi:alkaline phosphatase [Secundilactobacillus pentosiphilus]|uniref:Alkaline phosphatase n=1 Tax=Secundilactobacillus pentosiphilus TaxID=1714682 RepID=A0A1Z5IR88_9LACO|nr:DedA family protein [Secundilactobacillus pentosiphilus]GAX04250.1 alkaline phosphatase [Secundilactobacillus pentosiphilus]GAX06773.1 alkaline phosphatase [Secundilactobacillus pentosiphilus]